MESQSKAALKDISVWLRGAALLDGAQSLLWEIEKFLDDN